MMNTKMKALVPSLEVVEGLEVGVQALDPFGNWREVQEVYARGTSSDGTADVCSYVALGDSGAISQSYKEGEIVRTVPLCHRLTSGEIKEVEALINELEKTRNDLETPASFDEAGWEGLVDRQREIKAELERLDVEAV